MSGNTITVKGGIGSAGIPAPTYFTAPDIPTKTLRDEFAMAALCGQLSKGDSGSPQTFAQWSYQIADAMMDEREKRSNQDERRSNEK